MTWLVASKTYSGLPRDLYRLSFVILGSARTGSNKARSDKTRFAGLGSTRVGADRVRSSRIGLGRSRVQAPSGFNLFIGGSPMKLLKISGNLVSLF